MSDAVPSVYILNGEDDYAIDQVIGEMFASLGDPAAVEMNTTRLDGATFNLDQLMSVAGAMPFLARRRLVILTNPLARLQNSEPAREKFRSLLEQTPASTALLLVQHRLLTEEKDRKKNKLHWLERWGLSHPERAVVRNFPAPRGPELVERIIKQTKALGGAIDADAAALLATLVDGNLRLAGLEVEKLLAYVNYRHAIHYEDVAAVTEDSNQGDVFALVDALSERNGPKSMGMLSRLLEYNDYYELFGMIVRQFRLLIQAREVIDQGGRKEQVQAAIKLHPYVAEKIEQQARRFKMAELEEAFRRLVQVDEAVKTSKTPDKLALEYFVASFTTAPEPNR